MHQKDQPPEEKKFSSFDRLMSLGRSDETDFEVSKTFDQQPKMKQRDRLCYTLAQMECWFKIAQSDTLAFQKIKSKRRQFKETGLIKRQLELDSKKIIDGEKERFIWKQSAGNPLWAKQRLLHFRGTVRRPRN